MILFDSREGRVVGESPRRMNDDAEYEWLSSKATGDVEHLLLVDTLPFFLVPAFHHLEGWNEAVCGGAWGRWATGWGEKLRRALDLEHWAAFNFSFRRLEKILIEVATGKRGRPPATIIGLGGDVHHAYLAQIGFRKGIGAQSAVYQAVCSPFRNPLDRRERLVVQVSDSKPGQVIAHTRSRARPECPTPRSGGAWPSRRPSTTSSQRSSSMAALHVCESNAPYAVIRRTAGSKPRSNGGWRNEEGPRARRGPSSWGGPKGGMVRGVSYPDRRRSNAKYK